MCARYHSVLDAARLREFFRAIRDSGLDVLDRDVFPGRFAPIVRRPPELESGDEAVPEREAVVARFGLIPFWATDMRKVKLTYNARSETVATARPFQAAWKKAQHCIVPAEAIYEPDWRSNVHVPTRISAADGSPLAIAGLWNTWHSPAGERVHKRIIWPCTKSRRLAGSNRYLTGKVLHSIWRNPQRTMSSNIMRWVMLLRTPRHTSTCSIVRNLIGADF